jgi:Leucine-rich repeat (LRR) protein
MQTLERAKDRGLEELKLTNMDLEYLPEYIGNLTSLTSLDISGAQITKASLILLLSDYRKSSPVGLF